MSATVTDAEVSLVPHEGDNGTENRAGTAVATVVKPARLLRPIAPPAEMMAVQNEMRAMVKDALKEGRDYGRVKGIDKPFLFKAGAERIALAMGCYYGQPRIVEREVDHDRVVQWQKRRKAWKNRHSGDREFDWEIETGESLGLYRYVLAVPVINRATGEVVGEGIGSCSTMESKYIDRPRDAENTAIKMAHKRALVAAGLLAFGLSDEFTQDEDVVVEPAPRPAAARAPRVDGPKPLVRASVGDDYGQPESAPDAAPEPVCPVCSGPMWDNRENKRNPKAPDYKCKDRGCDGVIWPPKPTRGNAAGPLVEHDGPPHPADVDEVPF